MKFSINSKILSAALSTIVRVVDPKAPLMVLQNFKFTLNAEGLLTVRGMNAEAEAQQTLATTEHDGAGEFCINARQLADFVKKLPDCGVTFIYNGLQLEILVNKGKFVLPVIPAEQYPECREVEGDIIEIPAQTLIDGISRTKFATSTDEFRPVLQGVFMDVTPDEITFAATDTRVLAKYMIKYATGKTMSAILPRGILNILTSMFAKSENMTITLSDNAALFEADNIRFIATLINGKFVDYNRVISNKGQHTIEVDKKKLTAAIERVRDFGDSSNSYVKITVGGMLGELKVSAANDGMYTSGSDYVPCEAVCENIALALSADYLLSVLASLQGESVVFSNLSEGVASIPVHFTESNEGNEFLVLLMPMTIIN